MKSFCTEDEHLIVWEVSKTEDLGRGFDEWEDTLIYIRFRDLPLNVTHTVCILADPALPPEVMEFKLMAAAYSRFEHCTRRGAERVNPDTDTEFERRVEEFIK